MARWIFGRLGPMLVVGAVAGWLASPALAEWKLGSTTTASIAYNQGITFDQALGNFFFVGVSSTSNSALYRTNARLSRTASNTAVIPPTKEGYNHAGDASLDPKNVSITDTATPRVLLPLECYYPSSNPSNTCGSGAFGVVDPATLAFRYYVKLWTPQIQKAMWDEISPDGQWIFTSSGTHLLVYNAADINKQRADYQRAGVWGGLGGTDLGAVLPTGDVSGAGFYQGRLFLSLNRGTSFQVVSYGIGTASGGSPMLLDATPTIEITITRSSANSEPEGLAVTAAFNGSYPLGGVLHWQMLPSVKLTSRVLNYIASSPVSGSSPGGVPVAAKCVVPKLTNRTLNMAKRLLLAAHCRLGKVSVVHTSGSRPGKVVGQKPKPRTRLPIRSRVAVILGERR
jgi:hypothetical protein